MAYVETAVVIIPVNEERDVFVARCMSRGIAYLYSDNHGFIPNARIGRSCMGNIQFPNTSSEFGSEVIISRIHGSEEYVVTDVLPDRNSPSNFKEGQSSLGTPDACFIADSKAKVISSFAKKAVHTRVGQDSSDEINCEGEVKRTSRKHSILVTDGFHFEILTKSKVRKTISITEDTVSFKDTYGNEALIDSNGIIKIVADKSLEFGKANETAVLGKELVSLINDIISEISAITVTTAIGVMPIMNKVQVEALKKKVDKILSKYIKIQ